ncbi:MAG TPA: RluA family pseudouridine synthase [Candidatus Acidoferrales bacterium]|jgi:23S rRNA pseudouridine1911/1915/1917 synthase|nr:RluA family pseudouridine synthase [Candidatus Acidoferrales bacterium]
MPSRLHIVSPAARGQSFVVSGEDAGQRLDRFLVSQLPELSRARIQGLMDEGRVQVDGATRRASHRVASGECVSVEIPAPPPAGVEAEAIPLDVLYEDADVAVINKPAGMIVHPGAGANAGTLVAALLHRFGSAGLSTVGGPLRPGIVHRLDKDTSGAIVIARTDEAHRKLVEDFQERLVRKTYVALLHGTIKGDAGTVDLPVSRDLRRRSRMTARRQDGRAARTDWRARLRVGAFTFIEADLRTGRTHQIRVHFSALACPVVGDTLYGAPRQERVDSQLLAPLGRNFLHAARVTFDHPRTGKPVNIRAPLPAELREYLIGLGAAAKADPAAIDALLREYL